MSEMQTNNSGESKTVVAVAPEVHTIIGSQYPDYVIPLIDKAKSKIRIVIFDWRWYANSPGSVVQAFNQSIIRASKRGVSVVVISNYSDIVSILKKSGINARKLTTQRLVHAKLILIDDQEVVIGSHNFTSNAFLKNYEVSVHISDKVACLDFENYFNRLWLL